MTLDWPNCVNVRDCGGLRLRDGGTTAHGVLVRSDHPTRLTQSGWNALWDHGVRTIIELYTENTPRPDTRVDAAPRPDGLTCLQIAVEDYDDEEFNQRFVETGLWCSPLYFADALVRWPQRHAAVVEAFANASPGGVLVHCGRGHDRTGIVTLILLANAGVMSGEICCDYASSDRNMPQKERDALAALLDRENVTLEGVIRDTLVHFDPRQYLLDAGLCETTIEAARDRLRQS